MAPVIPILDLPRQLAPLKSVLVEGFERLVDTAGFIGGTPVAEFEQAFAKFCQVRGAVGVANGTDALMLSLRVLGVGRDDEVVVPAYTFIATAEAVDMVGAKVRLVDIDPQTYTMDPILLSQVDANAKAVIPVHLYGQPADMAPLIARARVRGYAVIEDAAQAHGARYQGRPAGAWGDLACFSFYPGKNLGAIGDAGAVVGDDMERLDRVRRLSNHGREGRDEHGEWGVNSRLDAIQALALGIKLPHLPDWNGGRQRVAQWYRDRLGDLDSVNLPGVGPNRTHVYHVFAVQVPERERLLERFAAAGIGTAVHYRRPIHEQRAYAHLGYGPGDFPVAEAVARRMVSFPIFPELTEAQADHISSVVRDHVRAGS